MKIVHTCEIGQTYDCCMHMIDQHMGKATGRKILLCIYAWNEANSKLRKTDPGLFYHQRQQRKEKCNKRGTKITK